MMKWMSESRVPAVLMRGGTSRGPYLLEGDLPSEPALRDRALIEIMGSPNILQLNGLGGGHPLTSKVAIVAPSTQPDADVDYLFAQVSVTEATVDTNPNCGNMLSGVGPFAIDAGLVEAVDGETEVRIFNRNTSTHVRAIVQTPGGRVNYQGAATIDGVPGSAAPILLTFMDAMGSKTSGLFPSGQRLEVIDGIEVTLADYGMPMMLLRAEDLDLSGDEMPDELDARTELFAKIEALRLEAGRRMGLGDVSKSVIPKVGILSRPRRSDGTITSRYLLPHKTHRSHAVTGALCVAVASRSVGTIAHGIAAEGTGSVMVEHPSGVIQIELDFDASGNVRNASLIRTARRIFEGVVIVPPLVTE